MSKYSDVKYLDTNITVDEYIEKTHRGKIFCPECELAPMHIVIKQETKPYFASNSKQEHHKDCQFYEDFIENKNLNRLIKSDDIKDKQRLNFLIESNLNSTMRILLNDESNTNSIKFVKNTSQNNIKQTSSKYSGKYKKESISRVHIKNLKKRTDHINKHIVIYGEATLQLLIRNRIDPKTQQEYPTKQLIFRHKNELIFSVFLNKYKSKYFNYENGKLKFAIFGELIKNKEYLNLNVDHTDNIRIER